MNILVLGQGGREHAIVKALKESSSQKNANGRVFCAPGSAGIAQDAECIQLDASDKISVCKFAISQKIDLVIVGPEQPLIEGVSDYLRENGILVFGPSQAGARLEGSKIYSKEIMSAAGVRTARFEVVRSTDEARKSLLKIPTPCVFKVDGLAAGKGVYICKSDKDLINAAKETFELKKFGEGGSFALIEEFISGWELSYLILTNGIDFEPLCLSQDHKRLLDGDQGPNTGGMGTIAPLAISTELDHEIRSTVAAPIIRELLKRGIDYRGILYIGLMISPIGPSVLEFNVRFGDPEAQVILPLLDGDWAPVFKSIAQGKVSPLKWKSDAAAACVVLAAEGYPESPVKGAAIAGELSSSTTSNSYVLHAGTQMSTLGAWQTSGGRVVNVVGLGNGLKNAISNAYQRAGNISWKGIQYRTDIGKMISE